MLSQYISFKVFVLSFIVGLIFLYLLGPQTKTIIVFPTPDNMGKIQYKDKAGTCFHYNAKNVSCPSNKEEISQIPSQK